MVVGSRLEGIVAGSAINEQVELGHERHLVVAVSSQILAHSSIQSLLASWSLPPERLRSAA